MAVFRKIKELMMKTIFKRFLESDFVALLLRVAVAFVLLMVMRVLFYLYNLADMGPLTWGEVPMLLRGAWVFDAANFAYTFGLFVALSLIPVSRRVTGLAWYRWLVFALYAVATAAVVFFNACDTVYFHYAKKRATIDEFSYADNGNTVKVMLRSAGENWPIVVFGLALIAVVLWWYIRFTMRSSRFSGSRHSRSSRSSRSSISKSSSYVMPSSVLWYVFRSVALAGAICLLVIMMRGGVGRAIRPINLSNAAQYTLSPEKASALLSNPFCILRTMGTSIKYSKYYDQAVLDSLYSPYHYPSAFTGDVYSEVYSADSLSGLQVSRNQDGKNVVIFILESFSFEHSAYLNPALYDRKASFMPFLDSLMQQGLVMRNAYANGSKSIDALPSILASIPSYKMPFATLPQALNPIQGLGGVLSEEGYQTWFFNGSQRSSMGFVAFAQLAGVTSIRTREDYERACGTDDYDGYWGIWDEPFLGYMARELSTAKQPFMASVFTLSSHHPFVVPEKYRDQLPVGYTKVQQPVAYTDLAMRRYFDYAKSQKWYDNTIFVFIADHVSSETYDPATLTATGGSHIIYFIYTPDGSVRGNYNGVTSQVDVMPTVLGMLGNKEPYFAFGRDIFGGFTGVPRASALGDGSKWNENFALNYRTGAYQLIMDSVTYFFDEKRITAAHDHRAGRSGPSGPSGPSGQVNVLGENLARDARADSVVKAAVQGYWQYVEKGDFLPGMLPADHAVINR